MKKDDVTKGLTKTQIMAVNHDLGPALVVAGAGTGKTTVITRRIAKIVSEKKARPEEVLALTFTEKAAREMLERVDELSDFLYSGLSISTFHSFGADLISEFSYELGLPADTRVLSTAEQILFIRDNIFEFKFKHYQNLSDPTRMIADLIKIFSRAKDEALIPKIYIGKVLKESEKAKSKADIEEFEKQLEIAKAYQTYNNLLRREGYIDYGDQIMLVLELLDKPSCAKAIKDKYKYALIDEFQDTNYAQSALIKKIFGVSGNLMVVGDDDQSIYKFRGAAVANILDFKKDYKNVKTFVLRDNFRSTQKILDTAYQFIQNNNPNRLEHRYQIDKRLVSSVGQGKMPKLVLFDNEFKEAEFVASKIVQGLKKGKRLSDFAILVRANRHAEEFLLALKKHGIPYVFSGTTSLYEKIEVKNLISLVMILLDPDDDLALFHLAASDIYEMNVDELVNFSSWSKKNNRSLLFTFQNVDNLSETLSISEKTIRLAKNIVNDLSLLREESRTATAGEVINLFLKNSGYYSKLTKAAKEGSVEAHNKISNIALFFDKIIHFQKNYRDHSLVKFYDYLNLILEVGSESSAFEIEEGLEAVSIISMHKAKGLEFDTVFISSLSDSHIPGRPGNRGFKLPDYLVSDNIENSNLSEERRLFYVAMTRAKRDLIFTASLDYGTKRTHKISRFVVEALGKDAVEKRFLKTEAIDKIKGFERLNNLYNITLEPIKDSEKLILSRAAIDDYTTCPFKYQLIHVTPIRIVADSTVSYGNAIHNTIAEYYKLRLQGRKVKLTEVEKWFDIFWNETGFLSKIHERKRYLAGKKALKKFYQRAEKELPPIAIEKEFKFLVGNNIIKGRYDAVFDRNDKLEIVDYKTSDIRTKEKADERTKKSSQLAIYALSWFEATGKIPDSVHLYFVESGLVGDFTPTKKSIEKTKENIRKAAKGIRNRNFAATPNLQHCRYCPFRNYCPVAVLPKSTD